MQRPIRFRVRSEVDAIMPAPDKAAAEWLDLKALQSYACVSERTLREWIHRASNPLPGYRVGTKILVRRSEFDKWLEGHRLERIDIDGIVEELAGGVKERG